MIEYIFFVFSPYYRLDKVINNENLYSQGPQAFRSSTLNLIDPLFMLFHYFVMIFDFINYDRNNLKVKPRTCKNFKNLYYLPSTYAARPSYYSFNV